MLKDPDKDFIRVNQILGKQPSIGPIPAHHIIPCISITLISYIITEGFFNLGIHVFFVVDIWLIISWLLLTGKQPHEFIDKFRIPPGTDWCNGNLFYLNINNQSQHQTRLKPIITQSQNLQKQRFMPFQNFLDLKTIVTIKKDNREVSAFLLSTKKQYQLVFAFQVQGLHNLLYRNEVQNLATQLSSGLKNIPDGEKMTFHLSCFSDESSRQQELTELADRCNLAPISILIRNEQKLIQELTESGKRQLWQQTVFCTWTVDLNSGAKSNDWLSKLIDQFIKFTNKLAGNEQLHKEMFYQDLLLKAFEHGYLSWELLLDTKMGLDITPYKADGLWEWLWKKFNNQPTPPIPQQLILSETDNGYQLQELCLHKKDIKTILIEGTQGRSSCPEHKGSCDTVWLNGKATSCAVLTMAEPPGGFLNTREQLQWIWKVISKTYIYDTEAIVEISPAADLIIKDNLTRIAKQSKIEQTVALEKGQGKDVAAELKQSESFEAQRKLYQGAKAINAATTFIVYRPTPEQLAQACQILSNSFSNAKILRERNIAWSIWLETLPVTSSWLLYSSSIINSRRNVFDTDTVTGVLPLTVARDIDRTGVEFITEQGNKPVLVDLIHSQTSRAIITGESGSGKSVLAWRFVLDALAANIPVVGIDISPGNGSTFETAINLLGDQGAYYRIDTESSNLMEPPDLRQFPQAERTRRLEQWLDFIRQALGALAMGKVNDPKLRQRVDTIILKTLARFMDDPDIIARYNAGFAQGWKSAAWQEMPTLKDFLKFCTKEQLNLQNFEEIDRIAINQIQSQCTALLTSPLGKAIGKPSTFSPTPAIKFFALSGLSNEQDQYLMALNAHAACIRNALAHPKSLFIGDEISILFKKDGFAQIIGELFAVGRKAGISCLIVGQDIDSICDCPASSMILQNTVYRITGRLTTNGTNSWIKRLGYLPEIINQNATETFLPSQSELYSKWLIEKGGRYWQTRFYPGEMILASVANSQTEQAARSQIARQYPNTMKGQLLALKHFTDKYIVALKEKLPMSTITDSQK